MLCSFTSESVLPILTFSRDAVKKSQLPVKMDCDRIINGFMWAGYEISRSVPVLCLVLLSPSSHAQNTLDNTSIFLTSPTRKVDSTRSMTSHFNSTASSSSPTHEQTPPDMFPATTPPHDDDTHDVFNYYFLFLVVFGVLVAILLWWLHRQKQRRTELARLSGQHALARDMEGWAGTRRFMHGRHARNHQAAFIRRQEGLDEHGEAPPPYQPKSESTGAQRPAEAAQVAAGRISIPLGTVSRYEIEGARPPAYHDARETDPT
ncbi:uncharacterized protein K460DRAFT_354894 [Cucurbitaria berberidis CBS 394.84]|uniref:Uncharacterized protein n=1 Tax=Cucurbitaria berberidis CBS 394.84 TaxID=1168544 RepID=A0A9P4GH29_9PLEO|nr:uncharacterized protein K460DRAFT_354894 [Cucurbitaria berberidis CBS 394.84]KAF1845035.1 hypothetical protein K460DRAFT_354894 [Cucurbitaria berberidis CBS 394.84]